MLWGLDRDAWISIWSGALGAIPAAVLAALVAMAVLKRSNRKQQELVELQLKEQRREAALVREKAAIADLISSVMGLAGASRSSQQAVEDELSVLRGAVVRWQLELGPGAMSSELHRWESLLFGAAINHSVQLRRGDLGEPEKSFKILNHLGATLSSVALNWHEIADDSRPQTIDDSREARLRGAKDLEEMTGVKLPG